jgi:hypothetical protein
MPMPNPTPDAHEVHMFLIDDVGGHVTAAWRCFSAHDPHSW